MNYDLHLCFKHYAIKTIGRQHNKLVYSLEFIVYYKVVKAFGLATLTPLVPGSLGGLH